MTALIESSKFQLFASRISMADSMSSIPVQACQVGKASRKKSPGLKAHSTMGCLIIHFHTNSEVNERSSKRTNERSRAHERSSRTERTIYIPILKCYEPWCIQRHLPIFPYSTHLEVHHNVIAVGVRHVGAFFSDQLLSRSVF